MLTIYNKYLATLILVLSIKFLNLKAPMVSMGAWAIRAVIRTDSQVKILLSREHEIEGNDNFTGWFKQESSLHGFIT